uniref:Uncharacterized protein n=1 Tax=Aegilops tauschii subsp. strangulata TaxID=200361 RepID=A0A453MFF4_AEGTS
MESISQQQVIKHGCSHRDELADHINKVNATELKEILRLLLSSDLLFGLHLLLCWFIICSVGGCFWSCHLFLLELTKI